MIFRFYIFPSNCQLWDHLLHISASYTTTINHLLTWRSRSKEGCVVLPACHVVLFYNSPSDSSWPFLSRIRSLLPRRRLSWTGSSLPWPSMRGIGRCLRDRSRLPRKCALRRGQVQIRILYRERRGWRMLESKKTIDPLKFAHPLVIGFYS